MMMGLLVFKEKLKNYYADHELYLRPVVKFFAALIAFILIKTHIGYMDILSTGFVMIGLSLIFAFLPWGGMMVGMAVVVVANIFALSSELGLLVLITMLIMMLLFFRFTPAQGALIIIIPLAFFLKIPYVIPIAAGLLFTPVAVVSVAFGTVIYYMLAVISKNSLAISNIAGDSISSASINSIINMIVNNKEMMITVIAFSVTIIVVYFIKRMAIDNSWAIAIIVGGVVDFIIILVGNILLDTEISIIWLIIGTLLSIILAYILEFFVFSVDYSRTEHTQFEDDEYYYYVKAVPKINVTAPEMNVKRINAQRKRKK